MLACPGAGGTQRQRYRQHQYRHAFLGIPSPIKLPILRQQQQGHIYRDALRERAPWVAAASAHTGTAGKCLPCAQVTGTARKAPRTGGMRPKEHGSCFKPANLRHTNRQATPAPQLCQRTITTLVTACTARAGPAHPPCALWVGGTLCAVPAKIRLFSTHFPGGQGDRNN